MGELARELVSLSGPDAAMGFIPAALLEYERANTCQDRDQITYGRFQVVPDMHTRKMMMAKSVQQGGPGSGFVALSGGLGTIEEVMEAATWQQLQIHNVGVCLLNTDGFWDGLAVWMQEVVVKAGFLSQRHWDGIGVKSSPEDVVSWLKQWKAQVKVNLDWGEKF